MINQMKAALTLTCLYIFFILWILFKIRQHKVHECDESDKIFPGYNSLQKYTDIKIAQHFITATNITCIADPSVSSKLSILQKDLNCSTPRSLTWIVYRLNCQVTFLHATLKDS